MKSQSIAYLLNESEHIYIGFWTLEMKCTQYGICGEVVFKNVRAKVFWKLGRAARGFRAGLENPGLFVG
jgi:hypothetical protein